MTMPKGWPGSVSATGPKIIEEKEDLEQKQFLLDRIERTLQTYSDIVEIAKVQSFFV